jgi:hypothetical protein
LFIETIDLLRCPREHEETWLVAAFTKMNGRFVVEGSLGCPICEATYIISNGIADFTIKSSSRATMSSNESIDPEQAIRLAAFLNLVRPGSTVVLEGDRAIYAPAIASMTQSRVIALNPSHDVAETEQISTIHTGDRIPLGTSTVDGVAAMSAMIIADAARVLKPGSRLVAPASLPLHPALTELARDDTSVVAEAAGPLIRLSR